jgi:hypothetical protein
LTHGVNRGHKKSPHAVSKERFQRKQEMGGQAYRLLAPFSKHNKNVRRRNKEWSRISRRIERRKGDLARNGLYQHVEWKFIQDHSAGAADPATAAVPALVIVGGLRSLGRHGQDKAGTIFHTTTTKGAVAAV